MSWKTLTALALLVVGLGGVFYYDTYWLGPARDKAQEAKGRLWTLEPKDVTALTIERKVDRVRLRRVEEGWELVEPVKARADRNVVEEVVRSLVTLRVDREIDPSPTRLVDFGLEPPEATVTLEATGRSTPLSLAVGARSPTGAWVYGKEGDKAAVVALPELVARDVARPAVDFRDRTLLRFDRRGAKAVDLQSGGDGISLEAGEGGTWRIVKPRAYDADADLVTDFLDKLESAKVQEFTAESAEGLARFGLDRPATVTIWLGKEQDRASRTLHFGRVDQDKKGVYVIRGGEPPVMLVSEELWKLFPKTVAALRNKVVVAYAPDKLQRVALAHGRGGVTIERDGPGWKLTAPEALKAETGAVSRLLWRIRDLRALGFLAEEAGDIPRYLAKPEVTVRIWEEGATEPKTLLLASSRETRGGQPTAVAAVAGRGPVVLVDGRALRELTLTAADLRDRSVFPAFEVQDVTRARLVAGGKAPLVVERKGEAEWRVLEPAKGPARAGVVSGLLYALKALKWKEIADETPADVARFGLDQPVLEVTLLRGDGGEIGALLVGREEGAVTYVRSTGAAAVYAVETKALGELRKAPSEIPG